MNNLKTTLNERTIARHENRKLIKELIDDLITLYAQSDNKLERIKKVNLMNIKITLENFIKWLRVEERYMCEPYIYTKDIGATAKEPPKNENTNVH